MGASWNCPRQAVLYSMEDEVGLMYSIIRAVLTWQRCEFCKEIHVTPSWCQARKSLGAVCLRVSAAGTSLLLYRGEDLLAYM